MPTKGYDVFYTEPDSEEELHCKVCGTVCLVERSLHGPTGSAEAMGGRGHWHDKFRCPHAGTDWHAQALELVIAIEESPSKRVIEMMQKDLDEILQAQGLSRQE